VGRCAEAKATQIQVGVKDMSDSDTARDRDADIIEQSDYPGEAAERIAEERGISFGEALAIVQRWLSNNDH
jgi:hypothetical protein